MILDQLTKHRIERSEVQSAKSSHKQFKKFNRAYFNELRHKLAAQILNSNTPNWGNLKVTVTTNGI